MLSNFIRYFTQRHLLTNLLFILIFMAGIFFWHYTSKEELPDIAFDFLRITTSYPGASARDVEHFITRPLEESIQGINGIHLIKSSTSVGVSNISVELERDSSERDSIISDIKTAILDVNLPDEVRDEPRFREFKTSQKAIIDIALYNTQQHLLDYKGRLQLQEYVNALESQLISKAYVSSVSKSGYLDQEIQVLVDPQKSQKYQIPISKIISEIKKNNIRLPAGNLEDKKESKVSIASELDDPQKLSNIIVQGEFASNQIRLKELAAIEKTFKKNKSITKVNGYEAVFMNVTKASSFGILDAVDNVKELVEEFNQNSLSNTSIKITTLDDESIDVRNRLDLILKNGLLGFILIIATLLLFLNFRASIWVALGIPFSFCFTMVTASMMGYTINNITLAAVIIVMGMVVDDAIVVAENISRHQLEGDDFEESAVSGTAYMFQPVLASVITTCVAFLPLMFFGGRLGQFVKAIPIIIILMLLGSLLESIIILPSHMILKIPFLKSKKNGNHHWFYHLEDIYGITLKFLLKFRYLVFIIFILLMILSINIMKNNMKFVLFPNEETTQIVLFAQAPKDTKRYETALLSKKIENIISPYIGKEVVGFRTYIARSRRGGAVQENKMRMLIEVVPRDKREKSLSMLTNEWNKKMETIKEFDVIRISKHRFGQEGGSPIELVIQENNRNVRNAVVNEAIKELSKNKALKNIEQEAPIINKEYLISIKRDKIKKLGIDPTNISTTLRSALEGTTLYELREDEEEIDVKLTIDNIRKKNINQILNIPVENKGNYLVPLKDIVNVKSVNTPESINREELRQTTKVYADIKEGAKITPLEIATVYENEFFKKINQKYPSTIMYFGGEVLETKESKTQFTSLIIMVITLIYVVLVLLFNSLTKPFLIMLSIPFGIVGVILAFQLHGISQVGFFAVVGILGLSGVVVNDSIVMLVKLDREKQDNDKKELCIHDISQIAKTRLRAVLLTTFTTVAGLFPTAYGWAGFDNMLSQMMLAMGWGLLFATFITLILVPSLYCALNDLKLLPRKLKGVIS